MGDYVEYVTKDNDRWDAIADWAYHDPYGYEPIIAANPHAPIRPVLPAGIKLYIPVRAPQVASNLPPWKR
jgi:phage tail protein X